MLYRDYLLSPQWKLRRLEALKARAFRCQNCRTKKGLNVHHRHYRTLGAESLEDLDVLCEDCHKKAHYFKSGKKRNLYRDVRAKNIENRKTFFDPSTVLRKCPYCEDLHAVVYVNYATAGLKLVLRCPVTKPRTKFLPFEKDLPIPVENG